MAEKKKTAKQPAPGATAAMPAPADAPQVLGPGVVKRVKREPAASDAAGPDTFDYTPSEQVFRRRG